MWSPPETVPKVVQLKVCYLSLNHEGLTIYHSSIFSLLSGNVLFVHLFVLLVSDRHPLDCKFLQENVSLIGGSINAFWKGEKQVSE